MSLHRINWGSYTGEDIEKIIAMYLAKEHPSSINITPSRGDGGIDILDKKDNAVYQVKKFSTQPNSNQKRQIKDSLERLLNDPRNNDLKIDKYYLVIPCNPTQETQKWFEELCQSKNIYSYAWLGLNHIDAWHTKYPEVADYYIGGSSQLIDQKVKDILTIFNNNQPSKDQELSNITEHALQSAIEKTFEILDYLNNNDIHYQYMLLFGPKERYEPLITVKDMKNINFDNLYYIRTTTSKRNFASLVVLFTNSLTRTLSPPDHFVKISPQSKISHKENQRYEEFLKDGDEIFLPSGAVEVTTNINPSSMEEVSLNSTFSGFCLVPALDNRIILTSLNLSHSIILNILKSTSGIHESSETIHKMVFADDSFTILLEINILKTTNKIININIKYNWPTNQYVSKIKEAIDFIFATKDDNYVNFRGVESTPSQQISMPKGEDWLIHLKNITEGLLKVMPYFANSNLLMFDIPNFDVEDQWRIFMDYAIINGGEVTLQKDGEVRLFNSNEFVSIEKSEGLSIIIAEHPFSLSFKSETKQIGVEKNTIKCKILSEVSDGSFDYYTTKVYSVKRSFKFI